MCFQTLNNCFQKLRRMFHKSSWPSFRDLTTLQLPLWRCLNKFWQQLDPLTLINQDYAYLWSVRVYTQKIIPTPLYNFISIKNNMSLETWCLCVNQQKYSETKSLRLAKKQGTQREGNKQLILSMKPKVDLNDQHKYINYLREHLAKNDERVFKSPNSSHNWEISKISLREFKQVRNIIRSNSPKKLATLKSPKKADLRSKITL